MGASRLRHPRRQGDGRPTSRTCSFDPAQTTPIFEDLAQNHDFVIANTEYATLLSDVAAKYPDVHFLECDGHAYTRQPLLATT